MLQRPHADNPSPHLSRRDAISLALAASAAAATGVTALASGPDAGPSSPSASPAPGPPPPVVKPASAVARAEKPLSVLVLGGTIFLGPPTVEYLLDRGHSVTLFNRGKSNPHFFPDLEKLRGDRANQIASLQAEVSKGRRWDAVIDTSAYVPSQMRASTELLKQAVAHYVLVATVNVYKDDSAADQDEDAPKHEQWPDQPNITPEAYGPMKRGCEVELEMLMPGRSCSVRPALIAGPRDPSDRFSYWPIRALRGGEILAPVSPDEPVQTVDSRDLGRFLVHLAETRATGPFNALGVPGLTIGKVIDASIAAAVAAGAPSSKATYAPLEFLGTNNVAPWSDLPVWIPSGEPSLAGMVRRVGTRAARAGLQSRPIELTASDVISWWLSLHDARRQKVRSGLTADREATLLKLLTA